MPHLDSFYKMDLESGDYYGEGNLTSRLLKKSCSTQLSMNCFLLINVKMSTIVDTFMSRKNSILGISEPENAEFFLYFYTFEQLKFHAQLG